eukprot:CAMPEP_0181224276 /NCGR_PEP_ID=MMETSP1096-20121128/31030_1 /TAXON_ID=156174 ORGANISM="Chrysochromulina ericina, Strain CCMP281" /NCGR_SAMPLE_ID=MMETSP1096 /ASSEMBLY_ACC=CAM_ASM_000453 /LENGTH=85 /DNA_ID=CAMNT_0023317327 /DNA_START=183 /DNA_END=440 /DNA_ORIENTATION=+
MLPQLSRLAALHARKEKPQRVQQQLRLQVAARIVVVERGAVVETDSVRRALRDRVAGSGVGVEKRGANRVNHRPNASREVGLLTI